MLGIEIRETIGIGDSLQFSSLPENYYHAKKEKLIDVSKAWIFDHNPYVVRDKVPIQTTQLWNFAPSTYTFPNPRYEAPKKGDHNFVKPRPAVYLSNAEIWAALFNVPVVLNRPRLYIHEDFDFCKRERILLQTEGKSHGYLPTRVVNHVIEKYGKTDKLFHIGIGPTYGLPHIDTPSIWDLVKTISSARMVIGVDSGPCWLATCYPDIIVKVVRTKPLPDILDRWIPLEQSNIHSFWDSRERMVYNPSEFDAGFTWSYKRI